IRFVARNCCASTAGHGCASLTPRQHSNRPGPQRRFARGESYDAGVLGGNDMNGKIGLEEHFAISDTVDGARGFVDETAWVDLRARLLDLQDRRLAEMDRHGMEKMIISLHAP